MKNKICFLFLLIPLFGFCQKTFKSNGEIENHSSDPDDFGYFKKYKRFDCTFVLYADKVVINDKVIKVKKQLLESGFFSTTIHFLLEPNNLETDGTSTVTVFDIYEYRCTEILVEYDTSGEIECIKTKLFRRISDLEIYYWRKHVVTSDF